MGSLVIIVIYVGALYYYWPRKTYQKQKRSLVKLGGGTRSSGSHGSADFATALDMKDAELLGKKGFIVGKYDNKFLRFNKPGHLITFAPTRSGKGVGHVIPNLLDHPGSVIVNDIKGENHAVTSRHRAKFSEVFSFAPFNEKSNCYNPIDFIRVGTEYELDDVMVVADMMVIEEGKDPFWEKSAKDVITALVLHVANSAPPALKNLGEVRYLLMQGKKDFDMTVNEMANSKNQFVRKLGSSISATEPKVMASVLSVAKSQTQVWDSPRLKAITARSDFQPEQVKEQLTSLYLIIPPEYLDVYKTVLRVIIGIFIASLIRNPDTKPKDRVLFLVDEFPALGYMRNIEIGIGYLAGYGISLWLFIQDLSQLKANYEKFETFVANCAVRVAFGTNDVETSKQLSDMLGTTTISVDSSGTSKDSASMALFTNKSKTTNTQETSRPLMTPDEVMRIPFDTQLIFVQGCKPILAEKIMYFQDPYFKGKWDQWGG